MTSKTTKSPATARTPRKKSSSPPPVGTAATATLAPPESGGGPPDEPKPPAYVPTASQVRYLIALRETALGGGSVTDRAMAKTIKMSRATLWEWKQIPGFLVWLVTALKTEHDADFELAVARHLKLAIQGSPRSFEAVARVRSIGQKGGGFTPETGGEVTHFQWNYLIPRPPEALPAPGEVK